MSTGKAPEKPALGAERAAKLIARAGLCSRRDAEKLIAEGRVTLDGVPLESPAVNVAPGADLRVDGRPLPALEPPRLWRYHKPAGLITSTRDPQGRPTLFDRLPEGLPRVHAVGRLDLASEGLLLLTNDGSLKRRLELPATGWLRHYRVRVFGRVDPARLASLARGATVDGVTYGAIFARPERNETSRSGQAGTGAKSKGPANSWLLFTLAEGRNREVRRVCESLGLKVNRLIRMGYGPFRLGRLKPGELAEVPRKLLREQLGLDDPEGRGKKPGSGFAKAKPRPNRPLSRKKSARKQAERKGVKTVARAAAGKTAKRGVVLRKPHGTEVAEDKPLKKKKKTPPRGRSGARQTAPSRKPAPPKKAGAKARPAKKPAARKPAKAGKPAQKAAPKRGARPSGGKPKRRR